MLKKESFNKMIASCSFANFLIFPVGLVGWVFLSMWWYHLAFWMIIWYNDIAGRCMNERLACFWGPLKIGTVESFPKKDPKFEEYPQVQSIYHHGMQLTGPSPEVIGGSVLRKSWKKMKHCHFVWLIHQASNVLPLRNKGFYSQGLVDEPYTFWSLSQSPLDGACLLMLGIPHDMFPQELITFLKCLQVCKGKPLNRKHQVVYLYVSKNLPRVNHW